MILKNKLLCEMFIKIKRNNFFTNNVAYNSLLSEADLGMDFLYVKFELK